jgi:hypothetical protein
LEAIFKLIDLSLLLVEVLDQPATSVLHLVKTALQSDPEWSLEPLTLPDFLVLDGVLRVPNIVSDELFDGSTPACLKVAIINFVYLIN